MVELYTKVRMGSHAHFSLLIYRLSFGCVLEQDNNHHSNTADSYQPAVFTLIPDLLARYDAERIDGKLDTLPVDDAAAEIINFLVSP